MPVYHFVLHAYRSWNADHPQGYCRKGEPGVFAPDSGLAAHRNTIALCLAVVWDRADQELLMAFAHEVCARRCWRIHGIAVTETHAHLVVSWRGKTPAMQVQRTMKQIMALQLGRRHNAAGRRWFSRGGKPLRVHNPGHLRTLIMAYLPSQGGVCRCEKIG